MLVRAQLDSQLIVSSFSTLEEKHQHQLLKFPLLCLHPPVGMVTKPSTEQTQDFSIHNEDFPALPGPNYKDTTLTNNEESKAVSVSPSRGSIEPGIKVLTRRDSHPVCRT